jgi:hypothetical protein
MTLSCTMGGDSPSSSSSLGKPAIKRSQTWHVRHKLNLPMPPDDVLQDDNDGDEWSGVASDHRQPLDSGPASAATSSTAAPVLLSDTASDPPPTINSAGFNGLSPMPSLLSPLLRCPICNNPLDSPTTLHCGHSICSTHIADNCPVPDCSPQNKSTNPNIPVSSTVLFFPAESPEPAFPPISTSRVDVTISKIISLVSRVDAELDVHLPGHSSDDEDDIPPPPRVSSSSLIRPRRDSTPSPPRVRKRRRYSSPAPEEDDLLSHLRKQSAVQRSTRHDEPLLPSHPPSTRDEILSRFEKELLTELSCDICCTLFYQPVTTPCQHVRPYCLYYSLLLICHLDFLFQMSTPRTRPQCIVSYLQTRPSWLFLLSRPSRK